MVYEDEDPTKHDFWYPCILGLGTRISDPHVYVVFWGSYSMEARVIVPSCHEGLEPTCCMVLGPLIPRRHSLNTLGSSRL